jgi:glycosyltransferase involved in cell wall biosynthesis
MKILIIHNYYKTYGGEDQVVENQVKLFTEKGLSCVTYFRHNNEIDSFSKVQKLSLLKEAYASKRTVHDIERLIKVHKPDVAHVHNVYPLISPVVYSVLKRYGIPIVQSVHNYKFLCANSLMYNKNRICEKCLIRKSYYPCFSNKCYHDDYLQSIWYADVLTRAYKKGWFNHIDRFIVFHEFMRQKMREKGFEESKLAIWPNFTYSNPAGGDEKQGDYFLFMGRLSEEKGISTLIKAFNRVSEIKLHIMGDGPMREEVLAFAESSCKNVKYLGFKSGQQKLNIMRNAKAIIVASEWYENFPTVILESFSLGTPVIASKIGGIPYMVKDGVNGLLFEPGDPDGLLGKMLQINENEQLYLKLSHNALRSYNEQYAPERYFEGICKIYKEL